MDKIAFLDFEDKYVLFFLKNLKELGFNIFLFGDDKEAGKKYSLLTKTIFLSDLNYLRSFDFIFLTSFKTYKNLKKLNFFDEIKGRIYLINPVLDKKRKSFVDLNNVLVYDYIKDFIYYRKENSKLLDLLNNTHLFTKKIVFSLESYEQLLEQVFRNYLAFLICDKFFNIKISKKEIVELLNEKEKKLLKDLVKQLNIWIKEFTKTQKIDNRRWNNGSKRERKNSRGYKQSNK